MNNSELTPGMGLWKHNSPGHTKQVALLSAVHPGPFAAKELIIAAQLGLLSETPVDEVIAGISRLQEADQNSQTHGCFRWYAEESKVEDPNAAFFIGLNLLALNAAYRDELSDVSRSLLDGIFPRLDKWFDGEVVERNFFYPNKYLGALVCSWFLKEALGAPEDEMVKLAGIMDEAATYWREFAWGWGEHISDNYGTILMEELSLFLLLSKSLPSGLRENYSDLLGELLAIDDAYRGGPRVPTIRSYAFTHVPAQPGFRSLVKEWSGRGDAVVRPTNVPGVEWPLPFYHLFAERGWHQMAPAAASPGGQIQIPCCHDALASAWVGTSFRIGSLSRYPIMRNTDHKDWGLSWQTFPVAFCGEGRNWGFLRWHVRENGIDRSHPAAEKLTGLTPKALSDRIIPPIVGETRCHQESDCVVALRFMPALTRDWEFLSDGWDIIGFDGEVLAENPVPGGLSFLHLRFADGREQQLFHHPFGGTETPKLELSEGKLRWQVRWEGERLSLWQRSASVWFFGSGEVPQIHSVHRQRECPMDKELEIRWSQLGTPLRVSLGFGLRPVEG